MNLLQTSLAGMQFQSPLILSSGIMGLSASSLKRIADLGAGGVTTKSFNLLERKGHKCPAVLPFAHGLLNAIGLSNPGVDEMVREVKEYRSRTSVPIVVSIFGKTIDEFSKVTEAICSAQPDMIEVNVSCPNVKAEFGTPFGAEPRSCARITRIVKKKAGNIPISIKLSANCTSIAHIARVCEDNGADAITAINSVGPGMIIDINSRKPVLSNRAGGISGPCIHPIAVRCVWEIFEAVKIPIIGGGGVTNSNDALQLILAGATAVGIGSGIYFSGSSIFKDINESLSDFLKEKKLTSMASLIGAAHE